MTTRFLSIINVGYSIEDMESKLVVSKNPSDQLVHVCGPTNESILIISARKNESVHVITCTVEGENHTAEDYLWKEEDGDIVSGRGGYLIAIQGPGMGASLIFSDKEESKHRLKLICKLN